MHAVTAEEAAQAVLALMEPREPRRWLTRAHPYSDSVGVVPIDQKEICSATLQHERIVVAMLCPWARGNIARFNKLPIANILAAHAKIVAHRRRDVQARTLVQIRKRSLIAKHILPMVGPKGPQSSHCA